MFRFWAEISYFKQNFDLWKNVDLGLGKTSVIFDFDLSIFDRNFNLLTKIFETNWVLTKISTFGQNFDFLVLTKILIFDRNFDFYHNFRFLSKRRKSKFAQKCRILVDEKVFSQRNTLGRCVNSKNLINLNQHLTNLRNTEKFMP